MTFTQKTVSDESIFPTKYANEFPSSFESIARKILRLQFHVIAHLYAAHFREIALLGLHTHLNLTFAHLTALHRRFNLIDEKETDVLRDLEVALRLTDDTTAAAGNGAAGSALATGNSSSTTTTTAATTATGSQNELSASSAVDTNEVNLQLEGSSGALTTGGSGVPICTQPEANLGKSQHHHHHFGGNGGDGLVGGILGDLSTGEFGDTMRYCTSAVPSATAANNTTATNSCSTNAARSQSPSQQTTTINSCNINDDEADGGSGEVGGGATILANGNNGAGALNNHHHHLNNTTTTTNHNNNHNNHHQHHHHHHHPHAHHHHHHFAPNTGLIQCNATNAPTAPTSASTSTTA